MQAKLSTRPADRRCTFTAAAAAAALALLGTGVPAATSARSGTSATTRGPGPDLSRFYGQRVTWKRCDDTFAPKDLQCGKVTVPLDYARPSRGTLDLALARYRATGARHGSVVLNFGGPGGAGTAQLAAAGKDFMGLTNRYDVVSFDPRGVGRSSPVTCGDGFYGGASASGPTTVPPTTGPSTAHPATGPSTGHPGTRPSATPQSSKPATRPPSSRPSTATPFGPPLRPVSAIQAVLADNGGGTTTADRDPRAFLQQLKRTADACARNSGPVLRHIGTVNASRDLDVIRQALGDKKLSYLGFSYGTRLGAVYATQFPDRVGRLALDGVDTLTEPMTEQGRAGAESQQRALEAFLVWCAKDIACPFGQDPRTAREDVTGLVRSLDRNPVPTQNGGDFTGEDLALAMGQALYSRQLWPSLERALAEFTQDGDTKGLLSFTSGGAAPFHRHPVTGRYPTADRDPRPDGGHHDGDLAGDQEIPMDNLPAALFAVNCADDPDRPSAGRITAELGRLRATYEKASPVFGRYRLAEALMCYGRPRGTDFIRERVRHLDTPKMLLVGTRGDPATPYRWTTETAKRLGPSAVVLDNRSQGHTGYGSSKCVHRKVDDFLMYGTLPSNGSSCGDEDNDS